MTSPAFPRYPYRVVLRSPYALLLVVLMTALGLQVALWPAKKLDATLSQAHLVGAESESTATEKHDTTHTHEDGTTHGDEDQSEKVKIAHRHSPSGPVHEHTVVTIEATGLGFEHFQPEPRVSHSLQLPYASHDLGLPADSQRALSCDYLSSIFRPPIA